MTEKIANALSVRSIQNIVSLMTGLGFFGIMFKFINNYTNAQGGFLAFMFFPAILCAAALFNIKLIRRSIDEKRYKASAGILLLDIILFIVGMVYILEILQNAV